MLVGEVRCATTGLGSSWKLSGGSPWSSGATNVSKKSHVRRAIRRRVSTSSFDSSPAGDAEAGRLTQRATTGESSHRTRNGSAIQIALGFTAATTTAVAMARPVPPAICR